MCPSMRTSRASDAGSTGRPPVTTADRGSMSAPSPFRRNDARAPSMRASDAEREAAADQLRVNAAEGRLDLEELDARLTAVLTARTRADVDAALADLPVRPSIDPPTSPGCEARASEIHSYVAVMLLLLAAWLLAGAGHFWPLYPALGWGLPLLLGRDAARRSRSMTGA